VEADDDALFGHLANSGFWLESIDGYQLDNQPFLNIVWRPGQGNWLGFSLLDGPGFQRAVDDALRAGFTPLQVDSMLVGGQPRFNVIFRQNLPGAWQARHNLTQAQHDELFAQMNAQGFRPISVSVVSVGGQRLYTELYRTVDTGGFELRSAVEASQYQALYETNAAAGRFPSYGNAYLHNGQSFFSVVFTQRPAGARKDRHGLTSAQYQTEYTSALAAGLPTRGVSSFDGATGDPRFIAFWRQ